jgi:hypothetical protein
VCVRTIGLENKGKPFTSARAFVADASVSNTIKAWPRTRKCRLHWRSRIVPYGEKISVKDLIRVSCRRGRGLEERKSTSLIFSWRFRTYRVALGSVLSDIAQERERERERERESVVFYWYSRE